MAGAIASLEAAVAAMPTYVEAWFNLVNAHMAGGQTARAATCYRRVLALRPDRELARLNLGNALREAGDESGTEAAYRDAMARAPKVSGPPFNLANLLQELGRLDEAAGARSRPPRWRPMPRSWRT